MRIGLQCKFVKHLRKSDLAYMVLLNRSMDFAFDMPLFQALSPLRFLKSKNRGVLAVLLAGMGSIGPAQIDENGNGVSDVWEGLYGPLTQPDVDTDGDGYTNRQEAEAGTDPNDPDDVPFLASLDASNPGEIRSVFKASAGIRYQIFASPDLLSWFPAGPSVRGIEDFQEVIFDTTASQSTGTAQLSKWQNLSGGNLNTLKGIAFSGSPVPDEESQLTSLTIPRSDPDASNFGHWIRGWIVPPETGSYTFYVSGDDDVELWLSTTPQPEQVVLTAYVDGWTGYQDWDKYPEQQSSPVSLEAGRYYYFEVFHREWNGADHLSVGWTPPGAVPGTVEIIGGNALSTVGVSLGALLEERGRLFFRLVATQADSDGDGLTDYEEEVLGLNPDRTHSRPLVPDFGEAQTLLSGGNSLTLGVSRPRAYESTGEAAELVIFRSGSIEPLTVTLSVSGTAVPGVDVSPLPASVDIPGGARAVVLPITPLPDGHTEGQETVTVTLTAGTGYTLGTPAAATITVDDAPDVIHQARLHPPGGTSGASGTFVMLSKGNHQEAWMDLSISGLETPQTGAELYLSTDSGETGSTLLTLPVGPFANRAWDLEPESGLSKADLLQALDAGTVWVRIPTQGTPAGEIRGRLATGASPLVAAPAPPAAEREPHDHSEAARFLLQATFGPTMTEVDTWGTTTFEAWIDAQQALLPTYHLPYVQARRAELLARDGNDGFSTPRQEAFWQNAITADDQLRQRMAFALSQIFVVSQIGGLDSAHEAVTQYYDMLVGHSFGNYRDLLEDVTLSPVMGTYLSMIRNRKPDWDTGHEPDENYAREIMQLFSIGLVELHPDGSVKRDAEGNPIPTYTQDDIVGLAHIFTGWGPHYDEADPPLWNNGSVADRDGWFQYGRDMFNPMTMHPSYHDQEDRTIVGGVTLSGDLTGEQRMQQALDTLFHHPNVGPFMAKRLIQRFVTSNPSPGYIGRVSAVFDDNGSGVRGDLGAVVKALLLDPEARNPEYRTGQGRGRAVEPILRVTRLLRATPLTLPRADTNDDRLFMNMQWGMPEQASLMSPSVFNFFQPEYANPGAISEAGLDSPEFQIFSETTGIKHANLLRGILFWGVWTREEYANGENRRIQLDLSPWVAVMDVEGLTETERETLLIDRMDEVLMGGGLSPEVRQIIEEGFESLPSWIDLEPEDLERRVGMAFYLMMISPDAFILR